MPCTTILVGKHASFDGSTLMARNEDSGAGEFTSKKWIAVDPEDQTRIYQSVISGVKIPLPDDPMPYTAVPNADPKEGIWGEAGFNAANVAMSETETITTNTRVLGADPLVRTGIGEEDMLTIVLPYIKSAREGVKRLGVLLEEYGTYEMNGIGFQDMDEIWWLETLGGHHWLAKRVPDDSYVVVPNQRSIDRFDLVDAFGEQKNHLCSSDLITFIQENHLDLSMNKPGESAYTEFDARAAFGTHSDMDHSYNTPRAWYMQRYLNPKTYRWDGPEADYTPESDDLPWALVPEKKITIEDIKYVLSSYFQGTRFNPYAKYGDLTEKGKYRPIGINRNNFVAITQLRPYVAKEIAAIEWLAMGSNAFNAIVPFYGNHITDTPAYLRDTTEVNTTENFYWANRMIAALADAHYSSCLAFIERYQKKMEAGGNSFLKNFDKKFSGIKFAGEEELADFLEECNQTIADDARTRTYEVLSKVLFEASLEMKNAFSRSDA